MATTTAPHGRAAGNDRCKHCNTKAEATVSGELPNGGTLTIRVCLVCAERYTGRAVPTVTPDTEANVALCSCRRFIGHGGRAAHRCIA